MDQAFERFNEQIEAEEAVRDVIRVQVRLLNKVSRSIVSDSEKLRHHLSVQAAALTDDNTPAATAATAPAAIGAAAGDEDSLAFTSASPFVSQTAFLAHGKAVLAKCAELAPIWAALEEAINAAAARGRAAGATGDEGNVLAVAAKQRDSWKFALGDVLATVALVYYLVYGKLINQETMNEIVKVPESIGVPLDDYLLALASIPGELVSFSVNSVRVNVYDAPAKISSFVSDLYSGFRALSLKNDALRRRFDGIKYAVKKLDDIVYDLHIRKLGTTGSSGNGSVTTGQPATDGDATAPAQ